MPKVKLVDQSQAEIGDVVALGTATLTANMLPCNGAVVSRSAYPSLFDAIGTTFNTGGELSTEFRLPDLRGRTPVAAGHGVGLSDRVRGAYGGLENSTVPSIPSHTHVGSSSTDGTHTHTYLRPSGSGGSWWSIRVDTLNYGTASTAAGEGAHTHSFTTTANGSGEAHNNIHPMTVVGYAIVFR